MNTSDFELRELLAVLDRIANCGSVEDFTVAGIRAELRDALYAYKFSPRKPEFE
jgi:hypothetical protein